MIRFRCPHCKKPLQVKDHLAGKKAPCPTCKKGLVIPAAAPSPSATSKAPAAKPDQPPELPAAEVDALAAAAFTEELQANGKQEEPPALIDFKCEFCEGDIHAPLAEAGKRMQCPNPECRRLVKVPTPQAEKPKDWRALAKKGPTVAQMMQEEKIDDAAWGTQTDKVRAGSAALKDAGALPAPKAEPIGLRGWMRRITRVTVALVVLVLVVLIASRIRSVTDDKDFARQMKKYVEGNDLAKDPVVRAEVYRAIAEYKIRKHKMHYKALEPLKQALASLSQPAAKGRPIEHDLFLIDLALTMSELGGTEEEQIAKEKYNWSGDVLPTELRQILGAIKAPEARVMAMRALATRLLEEKQLPLATGLASQMSNPEGARRPPVTSQLVVLLLLQEKPVSSLNINPPSPKEIPEPLARVGFAEFNARNGNIAAAQELAFAKGPPLEQLEACVGVAQVLLDGKKANPKDAEPFADRALEIVNDHLAKKVKIPPWMVLQTIRVVARAKGSDKVPQDLPRSLPAEFRPRGYLELVLADAAANASPLGTNLLADIKEANPDSSSLDFGWKALARQNARVGKGDVHEEAHIDPSQQRFRPMADVGKALGHLDGR